MNSSAPAGFGSTVYQTHITNINARNVVAVVGDYSPNAVMIWSGNTQG